MIAICLLTTMSFSTLVGCDVKGNNAVQESKIKKATYKDFTYDVNPETFTLTVEHDGVKEQASRALPIMKVSNVKKDKDRMSWEYPDQKVKVNLEKKKTT